MREDVDPTATPEASAALQPVTAAYRDVQQHLGITPGAETGAETSG